MKRAYRLARSEDFQRIRRTGRSWSRPMLVLQTLRNDLAHSRVGLVVGRRVGTAVVRNRVRRLLRESVRLRWQDIEPGWDIVLIARTPAAQTDFWQVKAALDSLLERASLLQASHTPGNESAPR
jgi:ribonuclease P protein component